MPKVSFLPTTHANVMNRFLLIGDGIIILFSIGLAFVLHGLLSEWTIIIKASPEFAVYGTLTIVTIPLWYILISFLKLQHMFDRYWKRKELFFTLFELHLIIVVSLSIALFFTQVIMNRSLIGIFLSCTFVLMYLERSIIQFRLKSQIRRGILKKHTLLVGDNTKGMASFVEEALLGEVPPIFVGRI